MAAGKGELTWKHLPYTRSETEIQKNLVWLQMEIQLLISYKDTKMIPRIPTVGFVLDLYLLPTTFPLI